MIWDENGQMLEHTIFNCYLKEFGGERGLDIEEEICLIFLFTDINIFLI